MKRGPREDMGNKPINQQPATGHCRRFELIGVVVHCLKVTKAVSMGPFSWWSYTEGTAMVQYNDI